MSANRIAVVGGGISGLAAALAILDLSRKRGGPEPEVTVLESDRRPGGKIQTLSDQGFICEWGVNGFLNKEPATLDLVQRLDLQDRLQPASDLFKNRFLYTRGKLRPIAMHPLKFLFSGIMPFCDKVRLFRELWVPRRPEDAEGDESVASFARRRVGDGAFKTLVDPMQTGIFAGDPEQMSVASCFPRVVEVEREYGSLIKGMAALARERRGQGEPLPGAGPAGHLTSFQGGMQQLIQRAAEEVGPRLLLQRGVDRIRRSEDGFTLEGAALDQALTADAVVLACPAHASAPMVREMDAGLADLMSEIPYSPLAVVCLGYAREQVAHHMNGFGFLAPRDAGLRLLGALWTSSIFPGRAPDGQVLIRCMIGGARDPEALELSDEELLAVIYAELEGAMGLSGDPSFCRIFRHELGIPQYTLGHPDRIVAMEERAAALGGLVLGGNAYRGVSVNDCAKNAWPAAEKALEALSR